MQDMTKQEYEQAIAVAKAGYEQDQHSADMEGQSYLHAAMSAWHAWERYRLTQSAADQARKTLAAWQAAYRQAYPPAGKPGQQPVFYSPSETFNGLDDFSYDSENLP